MDTRNKILSLAAAAGLSEPLLLVTGIFDVLRSEHAAELAEVRNRTAGARLMVVVLSHPAGVLPAAARAELVAALRVVDYVVIADRDHVDALLHRLQPVEIVRREAAEAGRTQRLIDNVHRGQTR